MKLHHLLLTISLTILSATALAADGVGRYQCTGHDPILGKDYTVVTTIQKKDGIYYATWSTNDGHQYTGIGLREKNVLAFSYNQTSTPAEASGEGAQIYRIKGKTLVGKWVFTNTKKVGTEYCKLSNAK